MMTEAELFDARTAALGARRDVLGSRIDPLKSQVESTDNQAAATREQIALILDELRSVEFLLEKNLIQRSSYIAVKRAHVDLTAKLSDLGSKRAQVESGNGANRIEH